MRKFLEDVLVNTMLDKKVNLAVKRSKTLKGLLEVLPGVFITALFTAAVSGAVLKLLESVNIKHVEIQENEANEKKTISDGDRDSSGADGFQSDLSRSSQGGEEGGSSI